MENTFPQAFVDRINAKNVKGIVAEAVQVDVVQQADPTEYAVIVDRISQDVPFYRAYLKNAAIIGFFGLGSKLSTVIKPSLVARFAFSTYIRSFSITNFAV